MGVLAAVDIALQILGRTNQGIAAGVELIDRVRALSPQHAEELAGVTTADVVRLMKLGFEENQRKVEEERARVEAEEEGKAAEALRNVEPGQR